MHEQSGIDDLALPCLEAALLKLALPLIEDQVFSLRLHQTLAKVPERVAIRDTAQALQSGKSLEANAVKQLELHLLTGRVEYMLENQQARHQLHRVRLLTAFGPAGPGSPVVDLVSHGDKVHMLVQQRQRIPPGYPVLLHASVQQID